MTRQQAIEQACRNVAAQVLFPQCPWMPVNYGDNFKFMAMKDAPYFKGHRCGGTIKAIRAEYARLTQAP